MDSLVYASLMEPSTEDCSGWQKETIAYIINPKNKSKIDRQIRGIARGMHKNIQTSDVEDIFSEITLYMYKSDDYNINKAIDRSNSGAIVSIEGYINTCIKYCVIRHCSEKNKREKMVVSDTVYGTDDEKEMSLFDTIPDNNSEISIDNIDCDLEALCKSCECLRYRFGPDIYLVWYVRLLTLEKKESELYRTIMDILGIDKSDLKNIEKITDSDVMNNFAKAISVYGTEESRNIIERYVYAAPLVRDAVNWACDHLKPITIMS